jgi:phosphoribosylanthranilate isomerase
MKLKICGLKDRENILQVLECKPDYIGFIFYDKSPRYVGELDADFVQSISSVKKVGVFVNESEIKILDCVSRFGLDYVQLHGDETPEFCSIIKSNVKVVKAFQINDAFDFSALNKYENASNYFLFDSKSEQYGGSGKTFNRKKLKEYKLEKPYFLSGGIDLDNLKEISNISSQISVPFAIDINSQFEVLPGIKDINKLKLINLFP